MTARSGIVALDPSSWGSRR